MYRIGTLSSGIMLILIGIVMLISQFVGFDIISYIFKLWPLILIVLGLELVYYSNKQNDEKIDIKYDFISIILIFVMLIASVGAFILGNFYTRLIPYFM